MHVLGPPRCISRPRHDALHLHRIVRTGRILYMESCGAFADRGPIEEKGDYPRQRVQKVTHWHLQAFLCFLLHSLHLTQNRSISGENVTFRRN